MVESVMILADTANAATVVNEFEQTLLSIMATLEKEGAFVHYSEIIENKEIARILGESLKIG